MPSLAAQDLDVMRRSVFFDGPDSSQKLSRFWILLVLAAVIAAAGVVADSTATVIGAMIVAPLMLPIQGTMLAVVTADRANLVRSVGLVLAGAASAIAVGYLVGLSHTGEVIAATNSQVAGRVSPRLIDLLAALATGMVGSVALAREDISDTLPGVAIAISLVPPLSVVGLTLESGAASQSLGALLLFVTNVAAILATGTVVMAIYGAHRFTTGTPGTATLDRRKAIGVIAVMFVLIGVPLTNSSLSIARDTSDEVRIRDAARAWVEGTDWEMVQVVRHIDGYVVEFEGHPPHPDTDELRRDLEDAGVDPGRVKAELIPRTVIDLG